MLLQRFFAFYQFSRDQQADANTTSSLCILDTNISNRFNYAPPFYTLFTCGPTGFFSFVKFFLRYSVPTVEELVTSAAGLFHYLSWTNNNVRSNIFAVSSFDKWLERYFTTVIDLTYRFGHVFWKRTGPSRTSFLQFFTIRLPGYARFLSNVYMPHTLSIRNITSTNIVKPTLPGLAFLDSKSSISQLELCLLDQLQRRSRSATEAFAVRDDGPCDSSKRFSTQSPHIPPTSPSSSQGPPPIDSDSTPSPLASTDDTGKPDGKLPEWN